MMQLTVELSPDQAAALALFCKRERLDIFEGVAQKGTNEAELMREAVYILGKALAESGYNPR
ncbi:hypothetical protein EOM81_12385 [bacterium]|nr:hypothetical protein [bacterium]